MGLESRIPSKVGVVVIGAGFAGASTAAALARAGVTSGLVLERELVPGTHASGRNAAIARQVESDPALLKLAVEGVRQLRMKSVGGCPVLSQTGGLYLVHEDTSRAAKQVDQLWAQRVPAELLPPADARQLFPFLRGFHFDCAILCPTDGVIDIHALLSSLLAEAREGGFEIATDCAAESLILDGCAVRGLQTRLGEIGAPIVVDASGAWAGHLGRRSSPLPLKPLRRHLFFGGNPGLLPRHAPFVWDLDIGYYLRAESGGLVICPCDEAEHPPGMPAVDPNVADLLADKLLECAPASADVGLRRCWACLRTFAPDRLPIIGWDPEISGLFHVSGLGGFGVTTSLAVGELASARICDRDVGWIDGDSFSAKRLLPSRRLHRIL
jgi:glycine/D-amino acid oxidase-like deaminating enzyme